MIFSAAQAGAACRISVWLLSATLLPVGSSSPPAAPPARDVVQAAMPRDDSEAGELRYPLGAVSSIPPVVRTFVGDAGPAPTVFSGWRGTMRETTETTPTVPPDPHGSVGRNGIIHTVNRNVYYFSKGGVRLWSIEAKEFFPPTPTYGPPSVFDPKSIYDRTSDRFYVIALERHEGGAQGLWAAYLRLAVSKSGNPASGTTTDWNQYTIDVMESWLGGYYCGDYPGLGCDGQAVYVTLNMLAMPVTLDGHFRHVRILAFNKGLLVSGTATYTSTTTPDGPGQGLTLQPATVIGGSSPGNVAYFADIDITSTTRIRLWALSDPLGAHSLSSALIVVPNQGGGIDGAPQCNTATRIATFAPYAQGNAFWRDGSLWFCHTAGGSAGHAIVFYYDVATGGFPSGTPSLVESGGIDGGPGIWNYQPSIGGNERGEVGLVFTQSSATQCPKIMATARTAGATGFPAPVTVLDSGTSYRGQYTYCRWGDFGSVAADPFDESFWVCHEYALPGVVVESWATWWGNLQFPSGIDGWVADGAPLRAGATLVRSPAVIRDGGAGAFTAWLDSRNGVEQVYMQRVTGTGAIVSGWPTGGRAVPASSEATAFSLAPDGAGGSYVAWSASSGTRLERLASDGIPVSGWPVGGVTLSAAQGATLEVISDGAGGALITWAADDVRVQRVSAAGAPQWAGGGVLLGGSATLPHVVADGSGGAIVGWNPDARVQHIAANGMRQWTAGGVALAPGADMACLATDAAGGAYVAFQNAESSSPGNLDVFLQRVTALGDAAPGWPAGGIPLSPPGTDQTDPRMIGDGFGGVIVVWVDYRSGGQDLYASRIRANGALAAGWSAAGALVTSAAGAQVAPALAPDGRGGAILTWQDGRVARPDVYVQHLGDRGQVDGNFATQGAALCTAAGVQSNPALAIVADGKVIVAWEDARRNPTCSLIHTCGLGIYAQQAVVDVVPPAMTTDLSLDSLNCPTASARIGWTAAGDNQSTGTSASFELRTSDQSMTEATFEAGTLVPTPAPAPAGTHVSAICDIGFGQQRYFALKTIDTAGNVSPMSNVLRVDGPAGPEACTDAVPSAGRTPVAVELGELRPNPTRGQARVTFGVPAGRAGEPFEMALFDVAGRRLLVLASGLATPGYQSATLDGAHTPFGPTRAGVYFVKLTVGRITLSRALVIVR